MVEDMEVKRLLEEIRELKKLAEAKGLKKEAAVKEVQRLVDEHESDRKAMELKIRDEVLTRQYMEAEQEIFGVKFLGAELEKMKEGNPDSDEPFIPTQLSDEDRAEMNKLFRVDGRNIKRKNPSIVDIVEDIQSDSDEG